MSRFAVVLALVVGLFSLPSVAQPREPAYVQLQGLGVRTVFGTQSFLVLDYQLEPRSFEWLQQNRVGVQWVVESTTSGRYNFRSELKSAGGETRFMLPRGVKFKEVRVRMVGSGPRHTLEWMELAGTRVTSLTVPVGTEAQGWASNGNPQPRPPQDDASGIPRPPHGGGMPVLPGRPPAIITPTTNWAGNPDVIAACGWAFNAPGAEVGCLDAARNYLANPVPVIKACDSALNADEAELNCVKLLARVPVPAQGNLPRMLAACDDAFNADASTLTCVQDAMSAVYPTENVIKACDLAFSQDAQTNACVRTAAASRQDPTPQLQACDRGMSGDAQTLACFERAISR